MGCLLPPCTGKPEGLGELGCGGLCQLLPSVGLRWFLGVCLLGRVPSLRRRRAVPRGLACWPRFSHGQRSRDHICFCPGPLHVRAPGGPGLPRRSSGSWWETGCFTPRWGPPARGDGDRGSVRGGESLSSLPHRRAGRPPESRLTPTTRPPPEVLACERVQAERTPLLPLLTSFPPSRAGPQGGPQLTCDSRPSWASPTAIAFDR